MRFERKDCEFIAKDKAGRSYTIEVWVEQIAVPDPKTGLHRVVDGPIEMRTATGDEVLSDSPGVYRILTRLGDVEVTSDDPDAL
jgi:hypothetical protein